jgi:hypothetical protein
MIINNDTTDDGNEEDLPIVVDDNEGNGRRLEKILRQNKHLQKSATRPHTRHRAERR